MTLCFRVLDSCSYCQPSAALLILRTQCHKIVIAQAVTFYEPDLPHATMVFIKYRMWVKEVHGSSTLQISPKRLVDILQVYNPMTFPNVRVQLQLSLTTLPITSCESDKSLSQLKLIKTFRCSTIVADRLSGLSLQ